MKFFIFGMLDTLFLFLVLFFYLHRVGVKPRHEATAPNPLYQEWLEKTAELAASPVAGSAEETAWIAKVQNAFTPFTPEGAAANFPLAYAEDFYFRDAFHTYTDRQEMTDYMVKSAEMSPGVTFEFSPVVRQGIDFYLPWVMVLPGKDGAAPQRSLGMSHLRFNEQGQVIFHQDYWDSADVLVPRVPVANGMIELVRRRF
ncbi:MAG: nuclear transport factor 2 family protein [Kiritimatiellia bacterium]